MGLPTMFAALTLLDVRPPLLDVAMDTGVLVLAGIFFYLGVVSLGRWGWSRSQTPETERPPPGSSSPRVYKIVVGGVAVWVSVTLDMLDMRPGPLTLATAIGVLVLAGILFSLGVVLVGRWFWSRWRVPLTEPPTPSGSGWTIYRIVWMGGVVVWLGVTLALLMPPHPGQPRPDSGAIRRLRTINTAQVTYVIRSSGYWGGMQALIAEGLLDPRFRGRVGGYRYEITLADPDDPGYGDYGYVAAAIPEVDDASFGYYSGPDGVVRYGPEPDPGPGRLGQPVQ